MTASLWSAYSDASGSQADPHLRPLCMAGLLATELGWLRFENEWNAVLKHHKFNVPYMHMQSFAQSARGTPFEDWSSHRERRQQFIASLIKVIARSIKRAWAIYLPLKTFEAVNARYQLKEGLRGAYPLIAAACKGHVSDWMRINRPRQLLRHLFERGDCGQQDFTALMIADGYEPPQIVPHYNKDSGGYVRPFEAADLIAYEYATRFSREDAGDLTEPRGSWKALHAAIHCEAREPTIASLTALCQSQPQLYPPR